MKSKIATIKLTLRTKNPLEKTDPRIASASAALGSKGIKAIDFLKKFDEETKDMAPNTPLIVKITAFLGSTGRATSFKHQFGQPSITNLVKEKLGIEKFSGKPGKEAIATVDMQFVNEIAKQKSLQISFVSIEAIERSVIGTLKSMGIVVN